MYRRQITDAKPAEHCCSSPVARFAPLAMGLVLEGTKSAPAERVLSPTGTQSFSCQQFWEMLDLCSSERYVPTHTSSSAIPKAWLAKCPRSSKREVEFSKWRVGRSGMREAGKNRRSAKTVERRIGETGDGRRPKCTGQPSSIEGNKGIPRNGGR